MYVYDSHVIIKSNCGDVAEYFAHNYKQRQLMVEITGHSHTVLWYGWPDFAGIGIIL